MEHGRDSSISGVSLRKSRSGCRTCKSRRVKCDEVRPVCGNCSRRFTGLSSCEYGGPPPRRKHASRPQIIPSLNGPNSRHGDIIQNPSCYPTSTSESGHWRSLELRLVHHYTTVVSKCMPDCYGPAAPELWERIVPQLAFDSDLLLNPMLTVSALHMHSHSPSNAPMSSALARYLDKTLVNHRKSLQRLDEGLSEPLWLSAILLAHIYWLLSRRPQPRGDYELPFESWSMGRGIALLFDQKSTLLGQLGYDWGCENGDFSSQLFHELPESSHLQLRSVEEDNSNLFDGFGVDGLPESQRNTYHEAREYVLSLYRAYYSGETTKTLRRLVGLMTLQCPTTYRELLEAHDPLAMALLARMTVMLKGLDYAWWMNGKGEYDVVQQDISGICGLMPEHAAWAMDWPFRVASGDVPLSRPGGETRTTLS